MTRFLVRFCATLSIVFVALAASPVASRTISVAIDRLPSAHPLAENWRDFARLVENRSNGDLRVSVEAPRRSQIIPLIEAVRSGAVDGASIPLAAYASRLPPYEAVPAAHALLLPFVLDNDAALRAAVAPGSALRELVDDAILQTSGNRVLWWQPMGRSVVLTRGLNLSSLLNLGGARLSGPTIVDVWTLAALQGNPTDMPLHDLADALAAGVVDGVVFPGAELVNSRLVDIADEIWPTYHGSYEYAAVISQSVFESLSLEHRAIIVQAARDVEDAFRTATHAREVDFIASQAGQIRIRPVTAAMRADLRAATMSVRDTFVARAGEQSQRALEALQAAGAARLATEVRVTGPASAEPGQAVTFRATVTSASGTPTGRVSFRRDGTEIASTQLNAQGVARASVASLPVGRHLITARYVGDTRFGPSVSPALPVAVAPTTIAFLGGGVAFAQTSACAPVLGTQPHPVTARYSPSELGGLPSGVTLAWADGSEHLTVWGPMPPSGTAFLGGSGRQTWTRFQFYPVRPLLRIVQRQATQPHEAALDEAMELLLRLRVQGFAAIPSCAVTVTAVLGRE